MSRDSDSSTPNPSTVEWSQGAPKILQRRFRLVMDNGSNSGPVYVCESGRAVVGSHEAADIRLDDRTVSRFHCEIEIADKSARIKDLDSRNGTKVDGVRIERAYIKDGSVVSVGHTRLRFEMSPDYSEAVLSANQSFGPLLGVSGEMRRVFALLERAAESNASVLLYGEPGTGKATAAEAVHSASARSTGPFVAVDMASMTAGEQSAALAGDDSAFSAARGGTLFLNEIAALDPGLQGRLAKAARREPDVRLISSTSRDLRAEVNTRRFRAGLLYAIAVVEIRVSPLRDRPTDIVHLAEQFLGLRSSVAPESIRALWNTEFVEQLRRHAWPGNVTELRSYIDRCVALSTPAPLGALADAGPTVDVTQPFREARDQWLNHFERRYLEQLVAHHKGNVSAAARAAKLDRAYFYRLLAPRPALARAATVLALALACTACFDDQALSLPPPDADPPTEQRLVVGPGEFIEANFVVDAPDARVTAAFSSAGEFEWNLHRHDRDDFRQFDVIETGRAVSGTLVFDADEDGLFSYQWTNLSNIAGFAIDIELTLEGAVSLHSWD